MLRLLRPLTTLLGLVLLTANAASALALASAENRASGSAAVAEHLVGQNTRLSEDAARENITLRYDFASDSPVAAEGAGALSPEIASTFANGGYTATTLAEDMTAYRYSGGVSGAYGRFLTDAATVGQISSPVSASIALNLPVGATAETLNAFTIPAGTTIFTGGVAGGADSALQIFIQNSSVLIPR